MMNPAADIMNQSADYWYVKVLVLMLLGQIRKKGDIRKLVTMARSIDPGSTS